MVVLGILLMLAGLICGLVVDDTVVVNGDNLDMDLIGWILTGLGLLSVLFGLFVTMMYTNTRHEEEHDVVVDHVPGEEPQRVVRRRRRH